MELEMRRFSSPINAAGAVYDSKANSFEKPAMRPSLRTKFPETWIDEGKISANGETIYEAKAPDTITSWVASAFAIHEQSGLGVAPDTAKLRVFRPFFIRLNLPYSVKRGEKFALQVLVFNYMENEQDVSVTLKNENNDFVFLNKDGTANTEKDSKASMRLVSVPGGGVSKAVYFPIEPRKIGEIKLHVQAIGGKAGDAVEMPLKVEPEGYRVDRNEPVVIDLNNQSTFSKTIPLKFPADVVEGSQKARVDIIGDIMGPVLTNIDRLVNMPSGCGEQNMLNFVPNIVVMKYLRSTNRADPKLEQKAKKYMESGYQRELTYRRNDNSYSAFGNSDQHGSTWLTAFVVRSFAQARDFIFVDKEVLEKSIAFLNGVQNENGSFNDNGRVLHKDMMGGSKGGGVSLTAYVVLTLLENGVRNEKAIAFLENSLPNIQSDVYSLAVTAYALKLAGSTKAAAAIEALDKLKTVGNDGTVHWEARPNDPEEKSDFYQPRPVDVEVTAYALLTTMLDGDTAKGLPIVRWLTSKRNELGGYSSTQDTVMALQAMGAYAAKAYSENSNVNVRVVNGADNQAFTVTPANSIVLQSYELSEINPEVMLKADGQGIVFAQVAYWYHRKTERDQTPFYCTKDLKEMRGGSRMQLELCCNYTKTGKSNMALAEVQALTGYKFDEEEANLLTNIKDLQRIELDKDDTQVNIYFDALDSSPICLNLYSDLVYHVADQKPAQLALYDYYDPAEQLKTSYSSKQRRALQETCPDCWPQEDSASALKRAPENPGAKRATRDAPSLLAA
ncbi:unnamed protein product, partial [Mesorhabditis belari]|uniref:A-macroglobulin complement component n=1 Tax=Mesorhabditis belari TaxID=2138241 RepID=A0AAF3EVI4_9BILA